MLDKALIKLIKRDAQKGMSILMEQYTGLVYTIVKNKLSLYCTAEDIEEAVSDVFAAFYNKMDSVDLEKGSLSAYLMTIAKRKAVDKFRSSVRQDEIIINEEDYIKIPDSFNLENEAEKNAFTERLIAD